LSIEIFGFPDREVFHKQGKVVFAIAGGTIGNFSEAAFFLSLNRAAGDGDLLIISADTIDIDPEFNPGSTRA
jgi:uncharacterized SAM-dependent methyltransferase